MHYDSSDFRFHITFTRYFFRNHSILFCSSNIFLLGKVTSGYGRGSKKLGFATANLPYFNETIALNGIKNGVYFGWCTIENENKVYRCVANVGKSPTFVGEVID
jgi:FAD synthase